jgi:hypothetical protein
VPATPIILSESDPVMSPAPAGASARLSAMSATIPGEPLAASFTPPPAVAAPGWVPTTTGPVVSHSAVVSGAPATPAPPPRVPRRQGGKALLGVALVVLIAGGIGGVYALGAFEDKASPETTVETPTTTTHTPLQPSPHAPASLAALSGTWWAETGVAYDGVAAGETVELRVHDPAQLPRQGYVAGEAAFVLRPIEGQPNDFLVEARIRPAPPLAFVYDHTRSVATCVTSFSHAAGKTLKAVHAIDRLVVQTVKIDPPPADFVHEGIRVVACTGLAGAPATEVEVILGRNPVASPTPHWPVPHADAGVHPGPLDAGVHDAGVHDPGTHDAGVQNPGGQDAGAGRLGSTCDSDAQCSTGNCYSHRCLPAGKGFGGPCTMDFQCQSRHCVASQCK